MLKNILIILLILSLTAHADIINVPEDIETIQEAIHESEDGDTVLVQPGEYVENINFEGKAITVTSLILTTGNEAYIDSTIIDGNERDCVVSFEDQEDTTSILQGFTIRNGQQSYGGGIDCQGTSPMLIDLHITGNIAGNLGGGVYCNLEGSPQIRRVIIEENEAINGGGLCANVSNVSLRDVIIRRNIAGFGGGGIYLMEGSITLDYVVIFENQAGEGNGGGIENIYTEELILRNVTITRNSAEHGGGIAHGTGAGLNATLINCIVFNNSNEEIIIGGWDSDNPNIINIAYSDIEGGEDGIAIEEDFGEVEWGDGNIDEDPLFVDPDENDYYLTNDSPCINTGDPDSPEDPDGSRADMGALPYTHTGIIEGFVLDLIEDDPLVDAIVSDQFGSTTRTDDEGFFRLFSVTTQVFDLTASHSGYNDLTLYDQQVDDGDTLEVVFRLTHPTIQLSEERIDATLDQGDSTEVELTITNQGNGQLEWQAKKRLAGEAGADPWELRRSYSVSDTVHDARIEGVVFAENAFYVSGSNIQDDDNETMIYVLDRDGREINRFPQFGEARYGMRDLAWDGELIWGCSGNMVFGFTIEGDSITSFEGPEYDLSAITWDPDREVLWVARKTGRRIYAMKTDGSEVDSLQLPRYGLRVYGLAYWPDAPDDSRLYVFHNPDNYSEIVHKINPNTQDTTFVRTLIHEDGGKARGAFCTNQYDVFSWVFMCISNNDADDRIDIWQLESNLSWMTLEPNTGVVEAESTQDANLLISSTGLPATDIQAEFIFKHNAAGGETILPVTMSIISSVDENLENTLPSDFGITAVYPNPFNSSVTIQYVLNAEADVTLMLFDITGREVRTLVDDVAQTSGKHSIVLSGNDLPAGLYLLKLEAGYDFSVRKIILMP